jgi:hypothetical protein
MKPGPAKGKGGRPRKKGGSTLTKGGNKGYKKITVGPKGKGTQKYYHRVVTGAKKGEVVDHRDGSKSNNARTNLKRMSRGAHQAKSNRTRRKAR